MNNIVESVNGMVAEDTTIPVTEESRAEQASEVSQENIAEERKGSSILIFKDSYANSFIQFLANNYETIDIVDLRHFKEPISNFMKDKEYNQILIMYSFDNLSSDINIRRLKF